MRKWPDSLPRFVSDGYGLRPVEQTLRTDMEQGFPRARRVTRARQDLISFSCRMRNYQFELFRNWFSDDFWSYLGDSYDFTAGGLATRASIVSDAITGPEGEPADFLQCDTTAANSHLWQKDFSGVHSDSTSMFSSVSVKYVSGITDSLLFYIRSKSNVSKGLVYDCLTSSVTQYGAPSAFSVKDRGNGWYRLNIEANLESGAFAPRVFIILRSGGTTLFNGDGSSGVYLSELCGFPSREENLFGWTDGEGGLLGASGGASWFYHPGLTMGGVVVEREVRFVGGFQADVLPGMNWNVTGQLEVRDA